ncbi:MAG TPA: TolC family protein [Chitinophagaceae bacterium]|nr:TolC family protein [Chitinophagaceae bacterium]
MPGDNMIRRGCSITVVFLIFLSSLQAIAQQNTDSLLQQATLPAVIQYALQRQPIVQQSLADEEITRLQVKSKLSEWYPQVGFNYLYQHNFLVQTTVIGGNPVRLGVNNTSGLLFSATQKIFDRDVLLASRTKSTILQQSKQQTENTRIDLVASVSKAFYDVLATQQQIKVGQENIVRLEKSLQDAKARYEIGIVDKTDYKRAMIALNNAKALLKSNQEALKAKMDYLKSLMNYPESGTFRLDYDSVDLQNDIVLDTLRTVDYTKRIEYQLLQTQRKLQEANLKYNRWSYIPTISANGAYNFNYQHNEFGKLYDKSYPNSFAGLTLAFPIFQGGKRRYETQQAEWQIKRMDLALEAIKNGINAEYSAALANYKAAMSNFLSVKENVLLAREVYDVIQLQYRSGIKTYLEVVAAETDLRTAEINFYDALYKILSSKIDVQKSLGELRY